MSHILAIAVTVLAVLAAITFRLLFGASQVAAGSALGRFKIPHGWRRWLLGEHEPTAPHHS